MAIFKAPRKASSQRYTGYYDAERAGDYLIALAAGGEGSGNRVSVDGKVVINDWTLVRLLSRT